MRLWSGRSRVRIPSLTLTNVLQLGGFVRNAESARGALGPVSVGRERLASGERSLGRDRPAVRSGRSHKGRSRSRRPLDAARHHGPLRRGLSLNPPIRVGPGARGSGSAPPPPGARAAPPCAFRTPALCEGVPPETAGPERARDTPTRP